MADREHRYSEDEIAYGRKLAASPLGQELTRFTLQFAQPILIASPPRHGKDSELNNGTATLVNFSDSPMVITCSHVVEAYRRRHNDDPSVLFHVGNLQIDPLAQLIDDDPILDIATISLAGLDLSRMSVRKDPPVFHRPAKWPPTPVAEGDLVTLSGYPGLWRQPPAGHFLSYDTLSVGVTDVTVVREDHFICQFDREYWGQSFGFAGQDLRQLGGMSGGPVFVIRDLFWEFAGIIYESSEEFDLLYVRRADLIDRDGRIHECAN